MNKPDFKNERQAVLSSEWLDRLHNRYAFVQTPITDKTPIRMQRGDPSKPETWRLS